MHIKFQKIHLMKRLLSLWAVLFICHVFCYAQDGVVFRTLSFNEALQAAGKENKLLFIDCYTSWCGPCQIMMRDVFPQKKAGEFFNSQFVCVKYDMENGEGPSLVKKYNVVAYPTFLLLRPDGTEVHRVVGGSTLEDFIDKISVGFDIQKTLPYLERQYRARALDKKGLLDYYIALLEVSREKEASAIHQELSALLTEADKLSADFWPYFTNLSFGTPDFDFLYNHVKTLSRNAGADEVNTLLDNVYYEQFFNFFFSGDNEKYRPLKQSLQHLDTERRPALLAMYGMLESHSSKNLDGILDILNKNAACLTIKEVRLIFSMFQQVRTYTDKAGVNKLAAALEKIVALQPNQQQVAYLKPWILEYKLSAVRGVLTQSLSRQEALDMAWKMNRRVLVFYCDQNSRTYRKMYKKVLCREDVGELVNGRYLSLVCSPETAGEEPHFTVYNTDGTVKKTVEVSIDAQKFMQELTEK